MPIGNPALSHIHSQFRGPFALNMADDGKADDQKPADQKPDDGKKSEKKPDDTEGRISTLAKEKKDLETKLAAYEKEKRDREETEAKANGEHEKLAEQYKNESATQKAAREKAEKDLAAYASEAQGRVDKALEGVKDKDAKKKLEALIDGKSPLEQLKTIETVMSLAGKPETFGGATPASEAPLQGKEAKQTRYDELIKKEGKEGLSGKERQEKYKLMNELTKDFKPQTT